MRLNKTTFHYITKRMNRSAPFLLAILLAGCGQRTDFGPTPPHAYLDWRDRIVAWTGRPMLGRIAPCWSKSLAEIPTSECVRMTEPRRWRGLWRLGDELTRFCPEPANVCDYRTSGTKIWLSGQSNVGKEPPESPMTRLSPGLYRIEFVGRRTMYPGTYGHLSMYDHNIIVDRMLSRTEVGDRTRSD